MPGKVRLPAPEVISALLDVGHTFPPERWGFSWAIAGNEGRVNHICKTGFIRRRQGFSDVYCLSKDIANAISNAMSLLHIDLCVTFISELK